MKKALRPFEGGWMNPPTVLRALLGLCRTLASLLPTLSH